MQRRKLPMIQVQTRLPMAVWQFLADKSADRDMSEVVRVWITGLSRRPELIAPIEAAASESPPEATAVPPRGKAKAARR